MIWLVIGGLLSAAAVAGIGAYLGPDDLRGCGQSPHAGNPACAKVDAIVAISGGDTQARTAEAIKLYKQGWSSRLVFSGAALDQSGPSNAAAMKRQALAAGVPESAILTEDRARDTAENALRTLAVVPRQEGVPRRIILVTSGYHQRRASIEFRHSFSRDMIINHPVRSDSQWSAYWWLTPYGWWLAISELAKILFISFSGGA
ncbi:MAG: YdcF family protein [Candidatus Chaera renei]|uniref:YdcF family protein n=1 Tax=Candidatus Chaera renei TaxID=2506947 RepID=A0A4Q0AGI0_9BACT|nr:MAG: YdcF family protein [Candidatus Chaera renei]